MHMRIISPRSITILAAAFAFLLSAGAFGYSVSAQEPPPPAESIPEGQNQQGPQLGRLLDLTPDQLRQLWAINQRTAPEFRRARQRMQQAQRELDAAIYADVADDALVLAKVQEFNQAQNELARLRTLREYRFRQILTPDQLVRLREIRKNAQERIEANRRRNEEGDGQGEPVRPRADRPGRANAVPGSNTFRPRQAKPADQTPVKRP
jgi:Spy/CpxP family protein refolding chaperone